MDLASVEKPLLLSRSKGIKQATAAAHDRLDQVIMTFRPFADLSRYRHFLRMQYGFHVTIRPIYDTLALDPCLSTFRCLSRLERIEADLADLGETPGPSDLHSVVGSAPSRDLPSALGWLYVAEGSNLGAAFLLKEAAKLGLSESWGARHLAAPPEGRGAYWRTFTAALDAIELPEEAEDRVIRGAQNAFDCVRHLANLHFSAS